MIKNMYLVINQTSLEFSLMKNEIKANVQQWWLEKLSFSKFYREKYCKLLKSHKFILKT